MPLEGRSSGREAVTRGLFGPVWCEVVEVHENIAPMRKKLPIASRTARTVAPAMKTDMCRKGLRR